MQLPHVPSHLRYFVIPDQSSVKLVELFYFCVSFILNVECLFHTKGYNNNNLSDFVFVLMVRTVALCKSEATIDGFIKQERVF